MCSRNEALTLDLWTIVPKFYQLSHLANTVTLSFWFRGSSQISQVLSRLAERPIFRTLSCSQMQSSNHTGPSNVRGQENAQPYLGSNQGPLDYPSDTVLTELSDQHCHTFPLHNDSSSTSVLSRPDETLNFSYSFMLMDMVLEPHTGHQVTG